MAKADDLVEDHRRACEGFTRLVELNGDRWSAPSPCPGWDARALIEHVIGFHDVLLLRPLDAKPARPKDDPVARWAVTVDALFSALTQPEALTPERRALLPALTAEVLVHTWDLGQAIGCDVSLDPRLCETALARAAANAAGFDNSEMFGATVHVADDASVQDRLVGLYGRDPAWSPPST